MRSCIKALQKLVGYRRYTSRDGGSKANNLQSIKGQEPNLKGESRVI